MSQVVAIIQTGLVATFCGWFAERMLGSDTHSWFVAVFSGLVGLYLGPHLVWLVGWHWGPSVADHLVAPMFAGAVIACLFVKLLTLGLAAARR
jgi:uncharacterized membrane protein YeaQ/YmgE (transglycosylase-associated protein family)